jgi:lactoylglutathione lyase
MVSSARLNLVVIRSADIEASATCYAALGLEFVKHRHGKGLEHFACEQDGMVFEIYPGDGTLGVRLGFEVPSMAEAVLGWTHAGGAVSSEPKESEWGLRAVLTDPDGHKIELIERSETARSAP